MSAKKKEHTKEIKKEEVSANIGAITQYAADFVAVRWTGYVKASYTELYTFYVTADDSARLWVNGEMLFDKWNECCQEFWGTVHLVAEEFVQIRLEYREVTGKAKMDLQWSSFRQSKVRTRLNKIE